LCSWRIEVKQVFLSDGRNKKRACANVRGSFGFAYEQLQLLIFLLLWPDNRMPHAF
jgi:hypothetical protein